MPTAYLHGSDVLTLPSGTQSGMTPRVNVTRIDAVSTATLPRANS